MKKLFFLSLLTFIATVTANAQFKLGVKAGVNFSQIATDDDKALAGFNGGLIGQYKFLDSKFAIQPEILYSLQGAKYSESGTYMSIPYDLNQTLNLQYLNIPIMGQYYITPTFNIEVGPQIGFLTSAKVKSEVKMQGRTEDETTSIKSHVNTVDFGINLGAAYQPAKFPLGVFARYTLGISDIFSDTSDGSEPGANRVFAFGAFVKF